MSLAAANKGAVKGGLRGEREGDKQYITGSLNYSNEPLIMARL